jgi:hypothetical protein
MTPDDPAEDSTMKRLLREAWSAGPRNLIRKVKARLKPLIYPDSSTLPYKILLERDAVPRSNYGYCIYQAAYLAQRLNLKGICIIEFGVAGGNGLVAIEKHVLEIRKLINIEFEIFGFDSGDGLPEPIDYRDLPQHFKKGFYRMDQEALRHKLQFSKLVMGDIKDTAKSFYQVYNPLPVGCIFFDLDYYSSTKNAFQILEGNPNNLLPRIYCYFDDIIGSDFEPYDDFTGERLAIREFNESHVDQKLSPNYYLLYKKPFCPWYPQIYIYHNYSHPKYTQFVGQHELHQLPLVQQ